MNIKKVSLTLLAVSVGIVIGGYLAGGTYYEIASRVFFTCFGGFYIYITNRGASHD